MIKRSSLILELASSGVEVGDVVVVKPEVEDGGRVDVAVAPGVVLQRILDDDACSIEVVQHEQGNVILGANAFSELAGRSNRHSFRGHDGDVVALRQPDLLEQRREALLFHVEQRAKAAVRSAGLDGGRSKTGVL